MAKVTIIGAGAAGCFCAAVLHALDASVEIHLLEAGPRPMAKLAITGGGRCNLSNDFSGVQNLADVYPRGHRFMKRALRSFGSGDVCRWFSERGVRLKTEDGGRIFPVSDNALEIVDTIASALDGVKIECNKRVSSLEDYDTDFIVVTTGGGKGMEILKGIDVSVEPAVPSLFSFTVKDSICDLQGISAPVQLMIPSTSFRSEGPLLITDWGFSGPAVLRLSSYAARHLAQVGYSSSLIVNWLGNNEQSARLMLEDLQRHNPQKLLGSVHPLPSRLWDYLVEKAGIPPERRWAELGSKGLNRLVATLISDSYQISGKTRFKDEFVTCGGVPLSAVEASTLECKAHPGLYFAGEVLDIDAVTGGFNLQAAWTTAYIVAHSIFDKL